MMYNIHAVHMPMQGPFHVGRNILSCKATQHNAAWATGPSAPAVHSNQETRCLGAISQNVAPKIAPWNTQDSGFTYLRFLHRVAEQIGRRSRAKQGGQRKKKKERKVSDNNTASVRSVTAPLFILNTELFPPRLIEQESDSEGGWGVAGELQAHAALWAGFI